jgi:hypothetical protein
MTTPNSPKHLFTIEDLHEAAQAANKEQKEKFDEWNKPEAEKDFTLQAVWLNGIEYVPKNQFRTEILDEVIRSSPEEVKRQEIGHRWGAIYKDGVETYYDRTQEEVDAFNDCLTQVIEAINKLKK